MQSATEKQQAKRQRLEAQVRGRWGWTALMLFNISFAAEQIDEAFAMAQPVPVCLTAWQHPFAFSLGQYSYALWSCQCAGSIVGARS